MSQPPPPRYRIVERDGRLVTIDTWAKRGAPSPPPALFPPGQATGAGMDRPGMLPLRLVAAVLRERDAQGRRILTTGPNWDRKGPRTIALSPAGERRLGTTMLIVGGVIFAAFVLVLSDLTWVFPLGIVGAVLFGSAAKAGAPWLTRFLDSLGEEERD